LDVDDFNDVKVPDYCTENVYTTASMTRLTDSF